MGNRTARGAQGNCPGLFWDESSGQRLVKVPRSHIIAWLFSLLFLLVFHSCLENTYDPSTQGPTGVSC